MSSSMEEEVRDPVLLRLRRRLGELPQGKEPFQIFRVPAHVRELYKTMYEPQAVSIGPYHHGSGDHLRAMQEHKWRILRDYLRRYPHLPLAVWVATVRPLEARARACYAEDSDLDSDEFTNMLLLDGCFILDFIWRCGTHNPDPVMHVAWCNNYIDMDLLMVENQIPFFVLRALFDLMGGSVTFGDTLVAIAASYVASRITGTRRFEETQDFFHILDLTCACNPDPVGNELDTCNSYSFLRRWLRIERKSGTGSSRNNVESVPWAIPCATKLAESGIRFRSSSWGSRSFYDVTCRHGTIEMPTLLVEELVVAQLLNTVAFEQCIGRECRLVTSYAYFMGYLVNTADDVAILEENGILENMLASKEELVRFLNVFSRCGYMDFDKHHLAPLFRDVNWYCGSRWHRYRAKLVRDYFGNPWAIISLVAAVVLLILTFLQTFYAIFAYYNPM